MYASVHEEFAAALSARKLRPMTMKAVLELHLTCAEGKEVECARHLAAELRGAHWKILAALAAELVHEHENRLGATVVVVAGADQAERVLQDLRKAGS